MADIAAVVIQTLQWVGAPVTRQLQYLCCFGRNITSLTNEANELELRAQDLQDRVDRAINYESRVITRVVKTWLQKSNDIKYEKDQILEEVPNVKSGCLKLGSRFYLSRRAKKTTDHVKELLGQSNFHADEISHPAPAASTQPIPSGTPYEYESRKEIEEDIMAALRGGDVNMMGICGMGGLGKTTMAVKIMNRALKEHVFEEIVMAVVSQPIDKLKIQLDIGGTLCLELTNETPQARVQKLDARLRGTKRILLVLDDVWERLVPEDLGIPRGYKGCTILLTSRNHDVLSAMNAQKIFGMKVLSAEDSWIMFTVIVGTCVDNTELNSIAKEVVNECKGLPLALVTVGAALKDEVEVDIWKNSLRQLRKSDPDILEFSKEVYNPLKLSYDALDTKYQYVFLLCCLYPEDADIPLEHLTYFCMGLGMFEGGIENVEEARIRMRALMKLLKSRSLLLDSKNGDEYVRMHDVVRDVCIIIAKQKGYIGDNDCSWISSIHRSELPMGLTVPNLRLLFFRAHKYLEGEFTLDNSFLEGIRDLSVVCIERYSLVSLPHATQMLRNLNTLILDSCWRVETLSVVGEFVNLEILICRGCNSIEELPPGMKGLKRLKVLDLTGCGKLQRIGRGIVSSLVGLEELKMLRSFKKWEGEDREERENAGVRELEALTKLRWLEIEIQDPALASQNIRLSSKLDRFTVKFECEDHWPWGIDFDRYLSKKKMRLNWDGAAGLGHWIEMQLLRDTECLYLTGNGANNVDLTKLENIKMLELDDCESLKNVVTTSMDHGVSLNCFQNLKELRFYKLPALKQLWKSSQSDLGKEFLPQLEVLNIQTCKMMEGVFMWKGEDGNENNTCHPITIMFPKLKELQLLNLPNLISLCQGIEGIEFPLLSSIWIKKCGKMKGMVSNENNSGDSSNNADTHYHLFCESTKVSFGCLKELNIDWNPLCSSDTIHVSVFNGLEKLEISDCRGSLSLFTSSIARNLVNLKELRISSCDEMVEVIKDDDEEKAMSATALLFPKLRTLVLSNLPKLVSFCGWKCDVEFPSLKHVSIRGCPNMKNLNLGSVAAPNLESLGTDLNNYVLQLPFNSTLKELSVFGNENPLNCYEIHGSVFDRLEELTIVGYEGSMRLFSSSITGSLVNLTKLRIEECYKMVKVIEEKEEEKEKVVSAAAQTTLLFPKLHKLKLSNLPELVSFCEWKCDVEFPSLSELTINGCHNMKSFTSGLLTTPNLKSFTSELLTTSNFQSLFMGSRYICGGKDVNEFLQQRYFN